MPYLLTDERRSVKALAVRSNAKVNSRQASGGGDVKVICSENTAISLDR